MKNKNFLFKYFLYIILPFTAIIIVSSFFLKKPLVNKKGTELENIILSGNYSAAEEKFFAEIQADPLNPDKHRAYISNHFNIPERIAKNQHRDDDKIIGYYKNMSLNPDTAISDLGLYFSGYILSNLNKYDDALAFYVRGVNKKLKYLNNSIGYILMKKKQFKEAEKYFYDEIEYNNYIEGAYFNLSEMYFQDNQFDKLLKLYEIKIARQYFSKNTERYILFRTDIFAYIRNVFFQNFSDLSLSNITASAMLFIIWLIFILKLDIFEKEKFFFIFLITLLSAVFTLSAHYFYDLYRFVFKFYLNGNWLNDLLFCIFGIGFIEEFIKMIPVFIILLFTREMNESADYFVYPSLSGISFALMENLGKFDPEGLSNIFGRSVSASIMHIALSTFVFYGIFHVKYNKLNKFLYFPFFILSFFAAAAVHGLYDYWLVGEGIISGFNVLSLVILFLTMVFYKKIIVLYIYSSEFFSDKVEILNYSGQFLVYALSGVIIVQFFLLSVNFGFNNAMMDFFKRMSGHIVSIYYIYITFGKFK